MTKITVNDSRYIELDSIIFSELMQPLGNI